MFGGRWVALDLQSHRHVPIPERLRVGVVDGRVEEALDLAGVKTHGGNMVATMTASILATS